MNDALNERVVCVEGGSDSNFWNPNGACIVNQVYAIEERIFHNGKLYAYKIVGKPTYRVEYEGKKHAPLECFWSAHKFRPLLEYRYEQSQKKSDDIWKDSYQENEE